MEAVLPHTTFNQDGHVDFFVEARSIPGVGLSPVSFIIKNNGDGTMEPFWQGQLGMVTDAIWHNADDDSELELVAVGDWMAPVILDMQEDKQFSVSQLAGAENLYGFWKDYLSGRFQRR